MAESISNDVVTCCSPFSRLPDQQKNLNAGEENRKCHHTSLLRLEIVFICRRCAVVSVADWISARACFVSSSQWMNHSTTFNPSCQKEHCSCRSEPAENSPLRLRTQTSSRSLGLHLCALLIYCVRSLWSARLLKNSLANTSLDITTPIVDKISSPGFFFWAALSVQKSPDVLLCRNIN